MVPSPPRLSPPQFLTFMRNAINILLLSLAPSLGWCQTTKPGEDVGDNFQLIISPGYSCQSFLLERWIHWDEQIVFASLMSGEANAEGLGLPVSVSIVDNRLRLGLNFTPVFRYDVIRQDVYGKAAATDASKRHGFFADYHFSVFRNLYFRNTGRERPKRIGFGYSIVSPNLSFPQHYVIAYKTSPPKYWEGYRMYLEFGGYHAYMGFPLPKNFAVDLRVLYVPHGRIAYKAYWEAMMLFVTVKRDFRFGIGRNNRE